MEQIPHQNLLEGSKLQVWNFLHRFNLAEDDIWWKAIFYGRWPSMEDNMPWKTTFNERQPLVEYKLWWRITFDWRWPLMEEYLRWKTTFNGKGPYMEEDLWWKVTSNGIQPSMYCRWHPVKGKKRIKKLDKVQLSHNPKKLLLLVLFTFKVWSKLGQW